VRVQNGRIRWWYDYRKADWRLLIARLLAEEERERESVCVCVCVCVRDVKVQTMMGMRCSNGAAGGL